MILTCAYNTCTLDSWYNLFLLLPTNSGTPVRSQTKSSNVNKKCTKLIMPIQKLVLIQFYNWKKLYLAITFFSCLNFKILKREVFRWSSNSSKCLCNNSDKHYIIKHTDSDDFNPLVDHRHDQRKDILYIYIYLNTPKKDNDEGNTSHNVLFLQDHFRIWARSRLAKGTSRHNFP